jgi:hypothetical protein
MLVTMADLGSGLRRVELIGYRPVSTLRLAPA